jgi:4'-phosphopantetheinyl transferase EntD
LPPTEAGGSAKARLSRSCSTITFDPLEIEIDHVQRSILGRAMRLGVTIADVVHEQQAYEEAMRRALAAKQAESVRRAQQNKEFVAARRIARRPMWRSTTPVGGTMTGAPSRAKKIRPAMSHDEANAWALKMQAWQKGYREGNPT